MLNAYIASLLAVLSATPAPVTDIKVKTVLKRTVTLTLPGGTATLTLVKEWGRTEVPNKNWTADGERLPLLKAAGAPGYVDATFVVTPEKDEFLRIHQFNLDVVGTKGLWDPAGTSTYVRRGTWQSAMQATMKKGPCPTTWVWPVGTGLTHLTMKRAALFAMAREDAWTGFSETYFKPVGAPDLPTVDVPLVLRMERSGGGVLGLATDCGISVGFDGPARLSLCTVARNLKAKTPRTVRVRVWWGQGMAAEVGPKWSDAVDTGAVRAFFDGDSVGAENGSYADQLAARLVTEFGPQRVRTMNVSVGGATTASALERFPGDVLDLGGNLVVFQLCYNDVGKIKPADVAVNLRKMTEPLLARPGGRAIILTPLSYDKKRVDETLAKSKQDLNKMHTEEYIPMLQEFVNAYEADAKTKGRVAFVDIWHAMAAVREKKGADYVLLPDGSHPNKEGHQLIADAVWPELKRLADSLLTP